jgi:hypothetical protein
VPRLIGVKWMVSGGRPPDAHDACRQQVLDMGGAAVGQLQGVLGCTIQEAFVTYSGREGLGTQWAPGPETTLQDRGQQGDRDAV